MMPKNHLLTKIISACYPEEYEKRRMECELDLWLDARGKTLNNLRIRFHRISRPELLNVLKKLDSIDAFSKWDTEKIRSVISDTCSVLHFEKVVCNYTLAEPVPFFMLVWKDNLFYVSNAGTEWLKNTTSPPTHD